MTPVVRTTSAVALWSALLFTGCRDDGDTCVPPTVTADPEEIPSGQNETDLSVEVTQFPGYETVAEWSAVNGTIADPFALQTTYACAYDVSGPVEVCVRVTYAAKTTSQVASDVPGVGVSVQHLRKPHSRLPDPLMCDETSCMDVICPEEKNACPLVSSLTVDPAVLSDGEAATVGVVAEDPDDNPNALTTMLSATHGTIADPSAEQTTYTCDPDVGGAIKICVVASDGDSSCDSELCTSVRCPGDPLDNTCPIIESFSANPNPIPSGQESTTVRVIATDPDAFPEPLSTKMTSASGAFEDPLASETTFRCGEPGPAEIFVEAGDGDPACEETRSLTVQCPSDIRKNLCPQLFVINAIPSTIPLGQMSTRVETRAQDTDGLPLPLVLTLNALWGSFQNTANIEEGFNVVAQNAIYVCDRPGDVEVCVDATDGACQKTLCTDITCPADVPVSP